MSRNPGIAVGMMHEIASELLKHPGLEEKMLDVPLSLSHGKKRYPLGRFLRRKLRTYIGRDPNAPQEILDQQKEELQTLRKTAFENSTPLSKEIQKTLTQTHRNIYAKEAIWNPRRHL